MRSMRKTRPSSLRLESPAWWRWVRRKVGELLQGWAQQLLLASATLDACTLQNVTFNTYPSPYVTGHRSQPGASSGLPGAPLASFGHSACYKSELLIFNAINQASISGRVEADACYAKMKPTFWFLFLIRDTSWLLIGAGRIWKRDKLTKKTKGASWEHPRCPFTYFRRSMCCHFSLHNITVTFGLVNT